MLLLRFKIVGRSILVGLLLLLTISGIFGCSNNPPDTSTQGSPTANIGLTEEEKAKIEAEVKAKVEAEVKAAAEEREKKEAEEKAKAVEVKKRIETFGKTKYVEHAKLFIPALTDNRLELDQKTYDFIVNNINLFPAFSDSDIKDAINMVDKSINSSLLKKNPQPYFDKMASFSGIVLSIEERELIENFTMAIVHIIDEDAQSYYLVIYKSTEDILEFDLIQFWGVPVGPWSFGNVAGGHTNVQIFIGSHIEKLE